MQSRSISLFALIIVSLAHKCEMTSVKEFSEGLVSFISSYYSREALKRLDFVILDQKCVQFAAEVITHVQKNLFYNESSSISIRNIDGKKVEKIDLETSSIIFIELDISFKEFEQKFNYKGFDHFTSHHLVIMRQLQNPLRTNIGKFNVLGSSLVFYMTFISPQRFYRKKNLMKVNTFDVFSHESCAISFITKIRSMSKNKTLWNREFGSRNRKLNGCHLILSFPLPEMFFQTDLSKDSYEEIIRKRQTDDWKEIYNLLSYSLNFTYELDPFESDLSMYVAPLTSKSIEYKPHVVIGEEMFTLVISTGEPYSSYEKLWLPFSNDVWLLLILTFICAFLVFLVFKLTNETVRKFVYGSRVTSPLYNVLIVFLGQSLRILPGRNFARYHLMIYILFCLIIRTGYQGVQFDLIFKDIRKKSPDTIEGLIEQGYSINQNLHDDIPFLIPDDSFLKRFKIVDDDLSTDLQYDRRNTMLCAQFLGFRSTHEYDFSFIDGKKNRDPVKFIQDDIFKFPIVFAMKRNFILTEAFYDKIEKLFEAGIIQNMKALSLSLSSTGKENALNYYFKIHPIEMKRVALSWKHLDAFFLVWLGLVFLSILVFLGEIAVFHCVEYFRRMVWTFMAL